MTDRPPEFDREWLIPPERSKALLEAGAMRVPFNTLSRAQRSAAMRGLVPFGFGAIYDQTEDMSHLFLWCRPREPSDD